MSEFFGNFGRWYFLATSTLILSNSSLLFISPDRSAFTISSIAALKASSLISSYTSGIAFKMFVLLEIFISSKLQQTNMKSAKTIFILGIIAIILSSGCINTKVTTQTAIGEKVERVCLTNEVVGSFEVPQEIREEVEKLFSEASVKGFTVNVILDNSTLSLTFYEFRPSFLPQDFEVAVDGRQLKNTMYLLADEVSVAIAYNNQTFRGKVRIIPKERGEFTYKAKLDEISGEVLLGSFGTKTPEFQVYARKISENTVEVMVKKDDEIVASGVISLG
ncbi:hypothetical protein PF1900 [Pyrococcus furiosus DSM 3638]|uniref:Uncharacterized protein n=3 Tax=Pyrococcus furiosus TaxID=2261 RepID=Q8TZT3_PYRFU|nr:hypothetical protein PF1900 [Pyrococcus furiosus DSM 3638]